MLKREEKSYSMQLMVYTQYSKVIVTLEEAHLTQNVRVGNLHNKEGRENRGMLEDKVRCGCVRKKCHNRDNEM